jgi:xylono-1,5-lactonase
VINARPVTCLVRDNALLGEGPVWDPRENALYWVDIKGNSISRWTQAGGKVDRWTPPFQVASLVPAAVGGFVAGTRAGFARIDPASGTYTALLNPDARPGNRFNDGKLDRAGRFWAGTMDDAESAATGALYRLDPDMTATRVDDGYRVTNGPAFDRAGVRMYHTDSARQTIFVFDLDAQGDARNKREFARFSPDEGFPDGMTVDAEDCLWVAFWDGGCVRRLSPDGERLDEIALPVPRVTSCTFGGDDLATLFITTASIGLDVAAHPLAGSLFCVTPGVCGIADTLFAETSVA